MRRVTWTQELATTIFTSAADVGDSIASIRCAHSRGA
jgi:hypothetical protein